MNQQDNYGSLFIRTTSAFRSIPVPGATVSVRRVTDNGGSELFAVLTTDADGETTTINVPAPPASNSYAPGGAIPYSLVNIEVAADGYYSVTVQNVPIFSGITSTQNINMIPLPSSAGNGRYPGANIIIKESEVPNL